MGSDVFDICEAIEALDPRPNLDWDPEPETRLHPLAIPDLVDVDCSQMVYRWVRGEVQDGKLVPQSCGQDFLSLTAKSPWWSSALDIEDLICPKDFYVDDFMTWMAENGVAPGQPFLIAVPKPDRGYDYGGDYYEEWHFDLVRKMNHTFDKAARSWSRCLQRLQDHKAKHAAFGKSLHERAWRSHNTWNLKTHIRTWGTPNDVYQVTLTSLLEGREVLLCYVEDTKKELSFSRLLGEVRKKRPSLDLHFVIKQAPEWYRPTVWELLDYDLGLSL